MNTNKREPVYIYIYYYFCSIVQQAIVINANANGKSRRSCDYFDYNDN